ncbi:thioredoxin fold domain-containing protein [Limnobacter alexandrii]|uniref:thioredoxin fold domain-containing protein n=1 Tax=Limnobacter alexandrii TaxID=2570352 RepID=UPI0011097E25|nr:thioredoxin fold domain-containing protein [Limnobacter alexandrii]
MKAIWLLVCLAWFSPAFGAGGGALAFPSNLQQQQVLAVVVLFSLPDCAYCEKVRQQSLRHIHTDPDYKGRVVVYEIDFSDSQRRFTWFDGNSYTGKALAGPLNVKFSPTVMVFSAKGAVAGKPLLGASLPEFYGAYLDELIKAAWAM